MLGILLAACATADPGDAVDTAPPPPELDPLVDGLAPCHLGADDGRLDLDNGCVDGACLGMSPAEVADLLGEPECTTAYAEGLCAYAGGLSVTYADGDGDAVPDESSNAYGLLLREPWSGGTAGGLARDATFRCFPEQLGTPDSVFWGREGDTWYPRAMSWNSWYLDIADAGGPDGTGDPDGLPEALTLSNFLYY